MIEFELYPNQMRRYSTNVFLKVIIPEKTRKYLPVRCSFASIGFRLVQMHGIVPLSASLELTAGPLVTERLLNIPGETTLRVGLSWFPYNNPAIIFVDLQKSYTWEIKDVRVYLDNLQKYRKLSRKGRVSYDKRSQ